MGDHRQRAPFAHASSSADLTSPDIISPLRSFPTHPPTWLQKDNTYDKADQLLQPGPVYSLDTPPPGRRDLSSPARSRSPSPNPFQLPTLAIPGYGTIRFVSLCALWYACSALSSNTGKVILNNFKYPVTLTIVQFFFVAAYCILCSRQTLGWTGRLRSPTTAILRGTLPMAAFQVGGHIFGSMAISRVPVSTVHTIKALSPLFTVLAYALLFGVSYSPATYLSLLPLTLGVMLACSSEMTVSNILGLFWAFGSTLIFVSQNIFFKKIMPTNSESASGLVGAPKLDKINLLYFSSGTAFVLMIPVWIYSDLNRLILFWLGPVTRTGGPSVPLYFFLNGTVHFAQNLLAFAILSSTSPVTYSIASLVKRIAVICLAIVWFKQSVHPIQAVGIGLTAVGLWMYNNAKRDVEKGEKKMRQVEAVREGLLPTNKAEARLLDGKLAVQETLGLGLGKLHSSPKPTYDHDLPPVSKSSALRPPTFSVPSVPPAIKAQTALAPIEGPYPSPPASASSSPPSEPLPGPPSTARHRRMSVDSHDENFRLPPSAGTSNRPTTIQEVSVSS